MRISIVRGGGLAGVATETSLDATALSAADAAALREHARAVLAGAPPPAPPPRRPDELRYRVRVHDREAVERNYTEATLPEDVRRLIAWVDEHPQREDRLVR